MKIIFYCCLWTVKLSFLLFLRKLLFALPGYAKYWWAATAFWGVTFVGCILSAFTACPTVGAFSAAGEDQPDEAGVLEDRGMENGC